MPTTDTSNYVVFEKLSPEAKRAAIHMLNQDMLRIRDIIIIRDVENLVNDNGTFLSRIYCQCLFWQTTSIYARINSLSMIQLGTPKLKYTEEELHNIMTEGGMTFTTVTDFILLLDKSLLSVIYNLVVRHVAKFPLTNEMISCVEAYVDLKHKTLIPCMVSDFTSSRFIMRLRDQLSGKKKTKKKDVIPIEYFQYVFRAKYDKEFLLSKEYTVHLNNIDDLQGFMWFQSIRERMIDDLVAELVAEFLKYLEPFTLYRYPYTFASVPYVIFDETGTKYTVMPEAFEIN